MEESMSDVSKCPDSSILTDFNFSEEQVTACANIDIADLKLYQAAMQAKQENSITPLVKAELRSYIEYKRCELGKEDIQVDFTPSKPQPLSPHEITKKEKRKEQNRRAASKCRRRKKELKKKSDEEYSRLHRENIELKECVELLSQEIQDVKTILQKHTSSGQCCLLALPQEIDLTSNTFRERDHIHQVQVAHLE